MEKTKLRISIVLVVCALAAGLVGTSVSLMQTSKTISNVGSVSGIGVGIYQDQSCATPLTSITWGTLNPGSNKTMTMYIRNEGSIAVTLSLATKNWNPTNANTTLTLSWNYAGQSLSANQVLPVNIVLTVSSAASGISSFSFDIVITAQG